MSEKIGYPQIGYHAFLTSERDQFHLQTATDRIRTSFDQVMRKTVVYWEFSNISKLLSLKQLN